MLDRFKVPDDIAVRVAPDAMRATVASLFAALGMSEADAAQSADVLVYADTRGIDSHGVSNMTPRYVSWLKKGVINATPKTSVLRDTGPAVTIDGDRGLGLAVGPPAMDLAIERARAHGIGVVLVTNAGHYGAAAYHAQKALAHDMIGMSMTTGGVLVAPTHGAERLLGLNPIGIAAPADKEVSFIFDASMSSVAGNKIALLNRVGGKVLPGWVARADGSPVMEEAPVPEGFMMLPLGGIREIGSHKGFGLMMMVEVLTSLLAGGGGGPFRRGDSTHYFAAYNIDAFSDAARFKADMDAYLRRLLDSRPAPGEARVVYPGIEEAEAEADRLQRGIPYHPEVVEWFRTTCESLQAKHQL
ncbi:MAG TPA: Ldh family oxidoreductase [Caulobacteraceae bacterium]|nr:Ldh family oxidoreductase [Caulobacteraceae bacterium]